MRALLSGLLVLAACDGGTPEDTGEVPVIAGPTLNHTVPEGPVLAGQDLPIDVRADDPDGVSSVVLNYRTRGALAFDQVNLEAGDDNVWSVVVPGLDVRDPALEYWFEGFDDSQYRAPSKLPEGGFEAPYELPIDPSAREVPFFEDFEAASSQYGIYDLGWNEFSLKFEGAAWELSEGTSFSGSWAAVHEPGTGEKKLDDWLVAPALDLSSLPTAQVSWWQFQPQTGADAIPPFRQLWVSTGSSDPNDGHFERVADIEYEAGEWRRSEVVDLSDYAGSPTVILAWKYKGSGEFWHIDDVSVKELGADIQLVDWDFDRVDPGGSTTLSLSFVNNGVDTAGPLIVAGEADPGDGAFVDDVDVGVIKADETFDVDLVLDVDATFPDNTRIPLTVVAQDDADLWLFDLELTVGDPTIASIKLDNTAFGLVSLSLGSGDPGNPDTEINVVNDLLDAQGYTWDVDLAAFHDFLPPSPQQRWWVRVNGSADGFLQSFSIDYDGVTYSSTDLGTYLATIDTLFYLPPPGSPSVMSMVTDPDPVQPGDIVQIELDIRNDGGDFVGETTAKLRAAGPDVTVYTKDPIVLSDTGWLTGQIATLDGSIGVSADHDESTPVFVKVIVEDASDRYETVVPIDVPWPVLVPTGVVIEDFFGGDGDGLLTEGESADLEIALTNMGDLDTDGSVTCVASQTGGTATASFLSDTDSFGFLGVGTTKTENDIEVQLDAGSAGDTLEIGLACSDGRATYDAVVELVVGEPPWQYLASLPDDFQDHNDYTFDFSTGRYRVVGSELQLVFESYSPYDPGLLFIEGWGESPGAPWDYYQLVAQSGIGTLRGYDATFGSFSVLSHPTVTEIDDRTLMITIDVNDMDLILDTVSFGFAAGFCGAPTPYFCDHYPDAWGDPFNQGLDTDLWYPITW